MNLKEVAKKHRHELTPSSSVFRLFGLFFYGENQKQKCLKVVLHVRVLSRFSHVQLFVTPWTVAHQPPLSVEFSRQEYWSGCHFLLQGIFLTQGSNPGLLHCRQILYHLNQQGSPIKCVLLLLLLLSHFSRVRLCGTP